MAQTGQAGGRQGLENNRKQGPIHAKPPATDLNPPTSIEKNASSQPGKSNTNRYGS